MAKPLWITLSKSSGTGGGSVSVTASSNVGSTTTNSRSGSITVRTTSGITKTVSCSQSGNVVRRDNYLSCTVVSNTLGRVTSQYAVASRLTIGVQYRFPTTPIQQETVTMSSGSSSVDVSFTVTSGIPSGNVSNFAIRSCTPSQDSTYTYRY